ncbi:uncharacterized protein LOC123702168 [Colias croceus]|uniref:uncharacterized protein LOC123702168 n=1 Tax=Colias crocea TaxID=72248 RepID=UPI001E27A863|nr:uncharacterized protein LOC123702168 [Colias croceus]
MLTCGLVLLAATFVASSGLDSLFPEQKQYHYDLKANVSVGSLDSASYWSMGGRLLVLLYDRNRIRLQLEGLQASLWSRNNGYASYHSEDAVFYLSQPWEVEYQENGFISSIYFGNDTTWSKNIKRAISINFQMKKDVGSYTNTEPCLYASCVMIYTARGNSIKKYSSIQFSSGGMEYSWSSVPWVNSVGRVPENIATSERIYELDEHGLTSLNMKGDFRYKVNEHILSVTSELSLYLDSESPAPQTSKLDISKETIQYQANDFADPTNGIRTSSQEHLKNRTYEILMKIATKGIDADNIVRNEALIHSLDFIDLLNTVSRLSYDSLVQLFADLVLGTSYDLETARNMFLEVLPHARSEACARFIKYLVIEQKSKIEDATLLSLIRKLPFNVAMGNHSQSLLEDLETFTKLGLDFPTDIRHAGILSFAILAYKTAEANQVKQDYFDNLVVKYFRMYSDCPQYLDRMIWLQGLCSLGYAAESYIRTIYSDTSRNRHERLWASLACGLEARGYTALEISLPILTNDAEHIQLRIAALHAILRSDIRATDFLFIHNYITSSEDDQLKRFWYTTVKSLETNKYFEGYSAASYFVPFVAKQVTNPDTTYWATNNYIITNGDENGAAFQMFSIGEESNAMPAMASATISSGGRRPYQAAIYLIAEGVSSHIFKKMRYSNVKDMKVETLVKVLEKMKMWTLKTPQEVHIDVVIKIQDKTVYATHVNQTRFNSWNGDDMAKSIMEFLRFGSHINQQMVYYPTQMEINLPSDLGTPVRLQTLNMAFTSVRGNLTAPPDPSLDLDWENDLHIRFQGTQVTSISTTAPLLQSEHAARVQRSVVAHLPIKFNVTCQSSTRSVALTWLNPFAQRAGVAMHSRVQITMDSKSGRDAYTVSSRPISNVNEKGIFFDCEQQTSGSEVIEKYIMSKIINYDTPHSQKTILDTIHQLTPLPGCGLILPPTRQEQGGDEVIRVKFTLGNVSLERIDRVEANFGVVLSYYSLDEKNVFLKIDSNTKIRSAGRNVSVEWNLYVKQPHAADPKRTHWKLCYKEDDVSHAPADEDITTTPSAFEGRTTITYRSSDKFSSCAMDDSSSVSIRYRGAPKYVQGSLERRVDLQVMGQRLQDFDLLPKLGLMGGTPAGQFLGSLDKDSINATAVIKERNGVASLVVNQGPEMQFKSDNIATLLDSLTAMQIMKKFGIYRECRLQELTVQTLSGGVEQLQPMHCADNLVLADCSAVPSFVILRQKDGGIKMYDADHSAAGNGNTSESPLIPINDGVRVASESTGVLIYKKYNETVILVPFAYMDSVCGECLGQEYNNC